VRWGARERGSGMEGIRCVRLPESAAASSEAGWPASGGGLWMLGSRRVSEGYELR
jgi:hypothetical protein